MSNATTPETSVMFSLAELATIEEERVREEAEQRAAMRTAEQSRQRAEQARRQQEEEARIAAERDAQAQREFEAAANKVRIEARERAATEVARIEAESKARLEADNAMRKHELEVLKVQSDSGRARLRRALAAVLGVTVLLGSAAAFGVNGHIDAMQREAQRVREDRFALVQAHDKGMAAELMALDRRHDKLQARAGLAKAETARKQAAAARGALEGGVDQAKLRAFGDALDALDARLDGIEQLTSLDNRLKDLNSWAASSKSEQLVADARQAATKAHESQGDEMAMAAYEKTLDALARKLAAKRGRVSAGGGNSSRATTSSGNRCSNPHDPLCGLDGEQIGLP